MQISQQLPTSGLSYETLTKKILEIFPRHIVETIQMSGLYDVSLGKDLFEERNQKYKLQFVTTLSKKPKTKIVYILY